MALPQTQQNVSERKVAATAGQTLVTWRREILKTIGQDALAEIDREKCMSWHQHCITYLPRCQEMADILFLNSFIFLNEKSH